MKRQSLNTFCLVAAASSLFLVAHSPSASRQNQAVTYVQLQASTPGSAQTGNVNVSAVIKGGAFRGDGSGVTALNASNITTGLLSHARLPSNIPRYNITGTFTTAQGFTVPPSFTSASAPFSVTSTALVANLNADKIDGLDSSDFFRASGGVVGGSVLVSGALGVAGATSLGTLEVGAVSAQSLDVLGAIHTHAPFSVDGLTASSATINGSLATNSLSVLSGSLVAVGPNTLAGQTVIENLAVSGNTLATGTFGVSGLLSAAAIRSTGPNTFDGSTTAASVNITGTLDVTGLATFHGAANVSGTFATGGLTTTGPNQLGGSTTATDLSATGNLNVAGMANLSGGLSMPGIFALTNNLNITNQDKSVTISPFTPAIVMRKQDNYYYEFSPLADRFVFYSGLGNSAEARFCVVAGSGKFGIKTMTPSDELSVVGSISASVKHFLIDNPVDPENRTLRHASVESDQMANLYRGRVTLDANGESWIAMPEWFSSLNKNIEYQLTALGVSMPGLFVKTEMLNGHWQIAGGKAGAKVSWLVSGERADRYAEAHPMKVDEMKGEADKGKYMNAEEFGLGKDHQMGSLSKSQLVGK